jgi:AcrR family transcriptional regulator
MSREDAVVPVGGEAASADEAAPSRRELAVARSLDPARVRAEKRVQRFLDAALELMEASPGKEFTVQEVVERSGQSLRSFYQYFAGKHELLLALFEESVRSAADKLEAVIEGETEPMARLQTFVVEHYRLCQPARPGKGSAQDPSPAAIADFGQQLLTSRPREAAHAFAPVVALLERLLDDAAAAGAIRTTDNRRLAGVLLQAVMFNAFASTISGSPVGAADEGEELWELVLHGIATD